MGLLIKKDGRKTNTTPPEQETERRQQTYMSAYSPGEIYGSP